MGIIKGIKKAIFTKNYEINFEKYKKSGELHPFDNELYSKLEGKYFDGLPVYYYLKYLNDGNCYDCSAILGLAMGENAVICRGELNSMLAVWSETGHGWVELGDKVYDTTWSFYCSKDVYYKLMKPVHVFKCTSKEFVKRCQGIGDLTIRDKKWYEEHWSMSELLIFSVRANVITMLDKLERGTFTEFHKNMIVLPNNKKELEKLLQDLPNITNLRRPTFEDVVKCQEKEDKTAQTLENS